MNKRLLALGVAVILFQLCLAVSGYADENTERSTGGIVQNMAKEAGEELPAPHPDDVLAKSPEFPDQLKDNSIEGIDPAEKMEPLEPASTAEPFKDNEVLGEEESEPVAIWGVLPLDAPYVTLLEVGGDARALPLETVAYAQYDRFKFVECAIHWRYDDFDVSAPGNHTIIGDVILPSGYIYSNSELIIEYEILVYDPAAIVTETVIAGEIFEAVLYTILPLDISEEDLEAHFQHYLYPEALLFTEKNKFYICGYTYDLSRIDTQQVGSYYPFDIDLPTNASMAERSHFTAIHVIDPDEVDLRGYVFNPFNGKLSCSWFKKVENPELWVSVDNGQWEQVISTSDPFGRALASQTATELHLQTMNFPEGHIYNFEVRYETDGYSVNSLQVDLTGGLPLLTPIIGDRHGYDRNPEEGGDEEGNAPYIPGGNQGGSNRENEGQSDDDTPTDGNGDAPSGYDENGTGGDDGATPIHLGSDGSGVGTGGIDTNKTALPYNKNVVPFQAPKEEVKKTSTQFLVPGTTVASPTVPVVAAQTQETNTPPSIEAPVATDDDTQGQSIADAPVYTALSEPSERLDEQVSQAKPLPTAIPVITGVAALAGFASLILISKWRVRK